MRQPGHCERYHLYVLCNFWSLQRSFFFFFCYILAEFWAPATPSFWTTFDVEMDDINGGLGKVRGFFFPLKNLYTYIYICYTVNIFWFANLSKRRRARLKPPISARQHRSFRQTEPRYKNKYSNVQRDLQVKLQKIIITNNHTMLHHYIYTNNEEWQQQVHHHMNINCSGAPAR